MVLGVTHDADDKRALFQRVVDDIVDQIRAGTLKPGDVLPTARRMADHYQVASMTAQRALRELQTMGLTYGIVGKGTFVHPEAPERVRVLDGLAAPDTVPEVIADARLNAQFAEYLLTRDAMAEAALRLFTAPKSERAQRQAEFNLLAAIVEGQGNDLHDQYEQYKARLAKAAGKTADMIAQPPANEETPPPTRRRSPKR